MVKIEVTKEARTVLAGALIGTILGALAAMFVARQKRLKAAGGDKVRAAVVAQEEELSLGQLAALVWHAFGLIREIADFGKNAE